ncbi:class I SAM-dependent methyltransferase [Gimibacter soli]|uniref:Class I SAM-dependent methyltransferase n=1 Tax=Gimibacter soli TaxID=3024400 RepID=A0AAE9XUL4_9PROT|nr:class I SAM-dependent methyltransferase [Gimibacter soli]WCL53049.1 class I SAM-dependent methyltransferase [Gimibacter soli]
MSQSIDAVRDYWNRRPCNIRHSPAEVGTKEYFDQVETRKYFVEPHIPGFAGFPDWKGKRVLEIGCGIGTDAVNFVRNGADYTAVELSSESLDITRKRFELFGLDGRLLEGNAEQLSELLGGETFDLIYSFGVLHHTPSPERAIGEIRKLIKPDGELRIMLYARNSWKAAMIEEGLDQPEAQFGCPVAFTYTEQEVRDLLTGFEIVDCRQDHIFPYQIEPYKQYEYVRQPWFESMPDEMFRALERQLGWHLLVTARPV